MWYATLACDSSVFIPFMAFPKGKKKPSSVGNGFKPGAEWTGNTKGRPPVGLSFAERCRAIVGADGRKLAWVYGCVAGLIPVEQTEQDFGSSGLAFSMRIRQLMKDATTRDRIYIAGRLEDRAFGLVKQEVEHSGEVSLPTTVVHEYHSS